MLAAVGPLQFDVVLHRLEHEFGARADLDHLDYSMARRTDADGARALAGQRAVEVLARRHDGTLLALFSDKWRLAQVQREHPDILLEPLIAGGSPASSRGCAHRLGWRAPSIWSRSPLKPPIPLVTPPPPDHCHIRAWLLDLVTPPKNCAHPPDFRQKPVGTLPL